MQLCARHKVSAPVQALAHAPSQLAYPERYERALEFYQNWPQNAQQPRDDTKLILYGLKQQVEHGPCQDPQPSSWSQIETAKWTAWTGLKNMDKMEAMRLFVKLLEEDEPNWYYIMTETSGPAPERSGSASTLYSLPADDTWRSPWISAEKLPYPRFEHSCCVLGSTMYLIGGNCGGRYLADVWQLDLETLMWSNITATYEADESSEDPLPPTQPSAAAVALPHRGRILLVGGHTKRKDSKDPLPVRVLDPVCRSRSLLQCTGEPVPYTRGSHAACIVGDCVYVVGGESPSRKLQSGLLMLDLRSNSWSQVTVEGSNSGPPPCSSPVCAAYQDRYIFVFGGGAVGQCSHATWYFDTATSEWHQPQITGPVPAARAGCCAALVGSRWYVFGGGNNVAGCPDMWMLDLENLGVEALQWQKVCTFDANSALASEGGTAVVVPSAGAIVAFGGYNGTYHNAISVFKPADVQHSATRRGAAPDEATDTAAQVDEPEIQPGIPAEPQSGKHHSAHDQNGRIGHHDSAVEDSANGASTRHSPSREVAQLQKQLAAAEEARDEAEAELKELRSALATEKDRAFRAEVQVSELQSKLQTMDELERELTRYKEQDVGRDQKGKKGGGIWGYISGA